MELAMNEKRRIMGEHLTPVEIFEEYIFPNIKDILYEYIWVDLFAGQGNLILPILEHLPKDERIDFFSKHIYLFDVQESLVKKSICKAVEYGIPREIAEKNIRVQDTLLDYPRFLLDLDYPIYHITNPPYLYIGYIVKNAKHYLRYFTGKNAGYQDLYQIAMSNDMNHGIEKLIYIVPSNFLFAASGANKIRYDILQKYLIKKAVIFEKKVFEHTGTNVVILFLERKKVPRHEEISFMGVKVKKDGILERKYILIPENKYRAGGDFDLFVDRYRVSFPLKVKYYLDVKEVESNPGDYEVRVICANNIVNGKYKKKTIKVSESLAKRIRGNVLFVRTIDTGSEDGKVGLYLIHEVFGVDGILVRNRYRTHPIQIFFTPDISVDDQILLKEYVNLMLEYFRNLTDSEFLTTYKHSNSKYIRKYLGLSQIKKLIQTFPILYMTEEEKLQMKKWISQQQVDRILLFLDNKKRQRGFLFND